MKSSFSKFSPGNESIKDLMLTFGRFLKIHDRDYLNQKN